MEKTINIGGRDVRLKSTGATALRYKQQFGKDYFAEIFKMAKGLGAAKGETVDTENMTDEQIDALDFQIFTNLIWVFAKTADPSIPDPVTWLDEFEEFPIQDVAQEVADMIAVTSQTKKK